MLLHIALQDGFSEDAVRVEAGGREIFSKRGVTSKTQIGYADSTEVELADRPSSVTVEVGTRGASASYSVPDSNSVYLGISLTREGQIEFRSSETPFGYL